MRFSLMALLQKGVPVLFSLGGFFLVYNAGYMAGDLYVSRMHLFSSSEVKVKAYSRLNELVCENGVGVLESYKRRRMSLLHSAKVICANQACEVRR